MTEDDGAEPDRRAANLWFERFERRRRERRPDPGRQRLVQFLLLAAAAILLILGLTWRSERLERVMGRKTESADPAALFSRELSLDAATGAVFFPLWEDWRRSQGELAEERRALLANLDELSAEHADLNAEQDLLLERLRALQARESEARGDLLDEVRERLGLWRAARLAFILERQ